MARIFLTFDGDMEADRIINLGAGAEPTDAVNKAQLDAKLNVTEKGRGNGIASLDGTGRVPASQLPTVPTPTIILSGTDHGVWIGLNGTSEQILMVPHGLGTVPDERQVFLEPVADPELDLGAVCLEYVKYLAAQSSAAEMAVAVKLRSGGTAGQQGQLRALAFAG
jgi:hypothetical protein